MLFNGIPLATRQDPRQLSIQEACPHCASLQRINDQLAKMVDTLRHENEELKLLLAQDYPQAA